MSAAWKSDVCEKSTLHIAQTVGLSYLQRRLLADLRFQCGAFPRTQEIRTKIGHLGFWSCVNYGNGIFCTISPGERHNYLALRLSRYRQDKQRPAAVDGVCFRHRCRCFCCFACNSEK